MCDFCYGTIQLYMPFDISSYFCFIYSNTPSKNITTTVTLSYARWPMAPSKIYSALLAAHWWIFMSLVKHFQTIWLISSFESLSKIPSEPITMKSCLFVILNSFISGSHIMALGFPFKSFSLDLASPKDLVIANPPGKTRKVFSVFLFLRSAIFQYCMTLWSDCLEYKHPPLKNILTASSSLFGLWSWLNCYTVLPLLSDKIALESPTLTT